MGALTSPVTLSIGSSAGQIPEASAAQSNLCADGYNIGAKWLGEGAPFVTLVDQFDNGFVAMGITTPNGITSRLKSVAAINLYTITSVPAKATDRINCFSIHVLQWPLAAPSRRCRFEATLSPSGRVFSIDLDPVTGVLIAKSAGLTDVGVQSIVLPLYGGIENVTVYRIFFALDVGADTTAVLRAYPKVDTVAAGTTIMGGVQVEGQVTLPTPFITYGTRQAGNIPRQVALPNLQYKQKPLAAYAVDPIADQDTWLECVNPLGDTVQLPFSGGITPNTPTGSRLLITQSPAAIGGIVTVQSIGPNTIIAPGGVTAAFTNLTFPSTDFPNVTQMLLVKTSVTNQWMILETSAGGASGGLFLQAGAGAVARTFQNKDRDIYNLADLGITPATVDCSVQTLQAITYCAANNKKLVVSGGKYHLTLPVVSTVMCDIECETANDGFQWDGAAGGTPITFNLSADYEFVSFSKLGIFASAPGNGVNGLAIVMAAAGGQFANFNLDLNIEGFFGPGLLLDNSLANHSAIFMGGISGYIANGIKGLKIGDSISIGIKPTNLPSVSPAIGNTEIGINCTFYPGAAGFVVGSNANISTGGGSIALTDAGSYKIYAECEYNNAYTYNPGTMNGGQIYIHNGTNGLIECSVQTSKGNSANLTPTYAIVFDGASCYGNAVRGSTLTYGESLNHIAFTNGAYANIVPTGANNFSGAGNNKFAYVLVNPLSYPQIGFPMDLNTSVPLPYANGWTLDGTNGCTRLDLTLDESGIGHLYGELHNGGGTGAINQTMFTLPVPVVPSVPSACATIGMNVAGAKLSTDICTPYIVLAVPAQIQFSAANDVNHCSVTNMSFPYYISHP